MCFCCVAPEGSGNTRRIGPTDFEVLGNRLFTEFGVGTQFDVQPDELGLVLNLHNPETSPGDGLQLESELPPAVGRALVACIARATTKTRTQPAVNADWSTAVVRVSSPERFEVSVIVKRLSTSDSDASERLMDRMLRAVSAGTLSFKAGDDCRGGHRISVVSVALMVPRKLPR